MSLFPSFNLLFFWREMSSGLTIRYHIAKIIGQEDEMIKGGQLLWATICHLNGGV